MNKERSVHVRVTPEKMTGFITDIGIKAGMNEDNAGFLADLLVKNDLMGVYSHGTIQMATYAVIMYEGLINPNPETVISKETPLSLIVDGDGGLGYFSAYRAAKEAIKKVKEHSMAITVTTNHGHIGAAGIYARMIAEEGFIGYVTSGHQLNLNPEQSIMRAAGGSPMSFAVPSKNHVPMVLDFGTMHDLYQGSPYVDRLFEMAPGLVFRSMGLGFFCQALGGFLAGVPLEEERSKIKFKGAGQGSLIIAFDPALFISADTFKNEMDRYMELTSKMQPMPGYDKATLPGVLEKIKEKESIKNGIPLDMQHAEKLSRVAAKFDVDAGFLAVEQV